MSSSTWALNQLSKLIQLDDQSLQEILDYTNTLDKTAAAEHLKNLLGDSPKSLEFISSFNSRREAPGAPKVSTEAAKPNRKPKKKSAPLHNLPARRIENHGNVTGGYQKSAEEDYVTQSRKSRKEPALAKALALSETPDARQLPVKVPVTSTPSTKLPPSASGQLISDLPNVRTSSHSRNSSRTASPAAKKRINVAGGQSMHGASTTIQDLDSAIRALEIQTNPSIASDPAKRRCDCLATRHPLLAAAPNCLNCGKIICVKEGIGPCTFCGHALLSPEDINSMVRSLKEERGKERMDVNNSAYRRADVASTPRPFSSTSPDSADATLAQARQHRDKLLNFQAENARRTRIIDEVADFETPTAGQSMWSSPMERAAQLKRQQKVLREQEWNAKPEYEKRKMVVSVDIKGGKAVRRMAEMERPSDDEDLDEGLASVDGAEIENFTGTQGALSKNPLMGGLIRPMWKGKGKDEAGDDTADKENRTKNMWRRVQDDQDDNEEWILDGGLYGGDTSERILGDEEHAHG
ncbi:MAG: hypothetical protein Q9191_006347 [Dirinaria sp. TL-2023a]